jgi:hypothetical protein
MGTGKKEKSKIVIILMVILGLAGVGTIASVLTKGVRVAKVVKTANKFNRASKSILKNEEVLSFPESMKLLEESHSVIDTTNKIKESGE